MRTHPKKKGISKKFAKVEKLENLGNESLFSTAGLFSFATFQIFNLPNRLFNFSTFQIAMWSFQLFNFSKYRSPMNFDFSAFSTFQLFNFPRPDFHAVGPSADCIHSLAMKMGIWKTQDKIFSTFLLTFTKSFTHPRSMLSLPSGLEKKRLTCYRSLHKRLS